MTQPPPTRQSAPPSVPPVSPDLVVTEQSGPPRVPVAAVPDEVIGPAGPSRGAALHLLTRRLVPRTLVARLAAGVVALVVVVVATAGAATYYALHSFLINRLDQQVSQTADFGTLARIYALRGTEGARTPPQLHTPQQVWTVAIDSQGNLLGNAPSAAGVTPLAVGPTTARNLVAHPDRLASITTTDGAHLRVMLVRLPIVNAQNQRAGDGYAVVGLSTDEVDTTLHQLFLLELAIGGGAVLIAFLLSTTGLRVGLGPLRRVTRTAQEVTAEMSPTGGGLDRRVPAASSGTEVGQLADSFNTMLDRVEQEFAARRESEERMRRFLADASHELRTPLTSIRGYAELARLQAAKDGTGKAGDDTLARIETEGTRMSRLVEDLMLLARGDDAADDAAASLPRERVAMTELVDEAVAGLRAAYPHRQIHTDVPVGLTAVADRDQILRVLRNLVTNAAVHTDPAGKILLRAEAGGSAAEPTVLVHIADQGPGLPLSEAAHVFERFWRADKARTRVRGGSGLGLAIVAQIVAAHRGDVRFDSSVERGSTVTVTLPSG